jgi:CheY-like chemotaxis protein
MKPMEQVSIEQGVGSRFQAFQNLMRFRVRDVLLVSSLYDSYIFEEGGKLYELIRNEYQDLNLTHTPELTQVSSGAEAINLAKEERRFDLIITTMHIEDMHPLQFAKQVRKAVLETPIVLLAFDNRELADLLARHDVSIFERIFIWQGDFHLVTAIIKDLEDRMNVEHDTRAIGVQSIILIEDNIRFYSSYLPLIYTEILKQSQRLISEGITTSHRFLRMRARPKILLCTTYEEAWEYYQQYKENVLGIISDIDFQRGGKPDSQAGLEFAKNVKAEHSDIPILLQSNLPENGEKAHTAGASFVLKDSPMLMQQVRDFMHQYFSFGDFIFRTPDGHEVGRASNLKSLEDHLRIVPEESLQYHSERNHFSRWLKARTEFWLAHQLRPRKVSDYPSINDLRLDLIESLHGYRQMQQQGLVTDFSKQTFDPNSSFARIGGGSLGGKARGLGFLNMLINDCQIRNRYEGIEIYVPASVVIGTEVFDDFLDDNNLRSFALHCSDDEEILKAFLDEKNFSKDITKELKTFLEIVNQPLAIRSSSLLEDSQYQPFAGVYETFMIPNNHPDLKKRLAELITTVKRVYASTFYQKAKNYIKVTSYRLEEEKMAVIIQKMVGARHAHRFYPDIGGVAKSYNFYPSPPQEASDGIVSVALGLGKMVVEGGPSVKFCPKYPMYFPTHSIASDILQNNQHEFFALDMTASNGTADILADPYTKLFSLVSAEADGTLTVLGSTYSEENDAIYDGISREGMRLVTFAPILKGKMFPLPEILDVVLSIASSGMGTAIEIEFAVNLSAANSRPKDFALLQMRPLVISREFEELSLEQIKQEQILCQSGEVLGNGIINNIYDVVVVDAHKFNRAKSHDVAMEVGQFNAKLVDEGRPYLLIGVGRWGTLDPWLGIPVRWDQISGAKAIVESGFKDYIVTPSQGSHFFQNLTAFMIGYFTINQMNNEGFIDWDWLLQQPSVEEKSFTKHLWFSKPLVVKMNGHEHRGVILKPE